MSENNDKLGKMIGLCVKAGALICGTSLSCEAVRCRKALLLLLAYNASDNTKKKAKNCAVHYGVDIYEVPLTVDELGKYCGKGTSVGSVAVTDNNFVLAINKLILR